jgi:hypothetical protein
MTWLIVLALVLVVAVLTTLICGLIFYVQFFLSPEKRWRDKLLDALAAAQRRARGAREELEQLGRDQAAEASSLQDEAFRSYLAEVSVNEVEAYPGIGPGTVGKLRGAGYVSLSGTPALSAVERQ